MNTNAIPVYLVSMEKDKERRNHFYKYIIPEFYIGIHGNRLKKYKSENNIQLRLGELGCYLSHCHLLKQIADMDGEYAIIMEDDAEYTNQEKIIELIPQLPDDFEVLCLGHNYYKEDKTNKRKAISNGNYILKHINYLHGTQAYLIKTSAIKSKINKLFPIKKPYDLALPNAFTTYIIDPVLIHLSKFGEISNTQVI